MVNKSAVTQVHTAARGKFNTMTWRGLKWHVFPQFHETQQILSKLKESCTQTQTYKLLFVVRLM